MVNQIVLVGRIARTPETKTTENGRKMATLTLAVPRNYKNSNGEYDTDFLDCTLWSSVAESTSEYCETGDMIGIKGSLAKKSYEDKDGKTRYQTYVKCENVMFLSTKKEASEKEVKESSSDPFAEFGQEIEQGNADDLPF